MEISNLMLDVGLAGWFVVSNTCYFRPVMIQLGGILRILGVENTNQLKTMETSQS